MCPIFRFVPTEEASPRAKANLLRGVLTGTLDLSVLTSDEFKAVADLCVHCHSCRLECPAGVDIPRLMRESKGAYVAANGFSPAEWAMTRLDLLGCARRADRAGGQLGPGQPPDAVAAWKRRSASPRGENCRGWRRGAFCAARPAAG